MPRTLLGRLGIRIMSINPENIFKKEKRPEPKGDEPTEDDDLPLPEQTEESRKIEEKALTKEAQEKYLKELQEITEFVQEVNFKRMVISADTRLMRSSLKSPDTIFFSTNYLDHYRQLREFISKEEVHQGIRVKLLEIKRDFKEPKLKAYQKLTKEKDKLEKLKNETETTEKELIKKAMILINGNEKVEEMDRKLEEYQEKTLSESEIKKQAVKHNILNILFFGPKNSDVIKIFRLKNLKEKTLPADRQKQFLDLISPTLQRIRGEFPFVDEKTIQNFGMKWLERAKEIGGKYLEYEEKKSKNGLEMMYQ